MCDVKSRHPSLQWNVVILGSQVYYALGALEGCLLILEVDTEQRGV